MKLIDKDALVAEIERRKKKNLLNEGAFEEDIDILSFINTLEVKEVNLEKELIQWHKEHFKKDGTFIGMSGFYLTNSSQIDIARHFFELGLRSTITEEDCKLIWNIGDEIPNKPEEEFFKELLKRYKALKGE